MENDDDAMTFMWKQSEGVELTPERERLVESSTWGKGWSHVGLESAAIQTGDLNIRARHIGVTFCIN